MSQLGADFEGGPEIKCNSGVLRSEQTHETGSEMWDMWSNAWQEKDPYTSALSLRHIVHHLARREICLKVMHYGPGIRRDWEWRGTAAEKR